MRHIFFLSKRAGWHLHAAVQYVVQYCLLFLVADYWLAAQLNQLLHLDGWDYTAPHQCIVDVADNQRESPLRSVYEVAKPTHVA